MIFSLPMRPVAAAVIVSLLVTIPGAPAWSQVAGSIRSASAGPTVPGGAAASAGSFGNPAANFLAIPSLALTAPSILAPNLAPIPAALKAAVLTPNANASVSAAVIAAPVAAHVAVSAPIAIANAASPISSLSAAAAQLTPALTATDLSAPAKSDGALDRLSSLFDGLIARKPAQDAVNAGERDDAPRGSQLGRPEHRLMRVQVTLADPGSHEALVAVLEKMSGDLGFRVDNSAETSRMPGLVTVRGAVPVSRLFALQQAPGVVDVAAVRSVETAPKAPSSENLLRAGVRKLALANPMYASLAVLPLAALAGVAFMGPVMGGIALGGAAAVLKPWMLGTVLGMTSMSYLSFLFNWIPVKIRAAATFAGAGGLAWLAYGLIPGAAALWLGANLAVSFIAAMRGLQVPAAGDKVGKIVFAVERSAFVNILGYQALLPILLLAGMLPLAYGILAVSSVLAVALLIKTAAPKAVVLPMAPIALGLLPGGTPSVPEGPKPGKKAAAPKKPAHEPFVPATRVVAALEKLLETNPAEALKAAAAAIVNEKERRSEVKIGAQRILDALPIEQTLPHYLELLKLVARPGLQTNKDVNIDPWWYLQRTALKRLTREAAALKPGTPELVDALKESYKDRNASVRLAAAETLTALGVVPGPEATYEVVRAEPETTMQPAPVLNRPNPAKPKSNKFVRWIAIGLLAASLGWLVLGNHNPASPPPSTPPAITQTIKPDSAAIPAAKASETDSIKVDPKDAALEQIAKDTKRTADAAERSAKAAEQMAKPKGSFLSTLFWTLAPIILMVWLFRKFMGGGGAAGGIQMKPKMDLEKPTTRFDDVAGIDESMVEVQEIIDFLRDPSRFKKLGARMPKGILMEGPPGTGKTLLARALAGETDATFISISGSDFVELYVGMGARRVRELFETARAHSPAIIFIDEIDAVGKQRGGGGPGNGGNDEREQTINQILKEMDGFDNSSGVLVVAATNQASTLDTALTRPGRFDRKIHVGLPEAMGREAILALHAKKARLGPDVDLRLIARRSAGLSGAFLENVINEAALLAARRGGHFINAADIDEAVDRATIGGKRSLRLSEELKLRIGRHEVGHVAANLLNENAKVRVPVNKVTIIPHGSGALGFAESGSEEGDKYLYTRAELEARLDTALGGLVAEKIYYGEWSTGPGSDLEQATRVARAMVQQLGMSEEMGLAQTAPNQYGQSPFGSETDARALVEINKLLAASKARVEKRLAENKDKFEALVAALVEKETLSSDEIMAILHPKPK
ncbi:MAG: ATP-dependent zinc metalloprotease FtsH [Elusimicrobia bacterium]|nr:ATP-dependent zinc metalloprotease FtsH [Elusimicrobiota bacterium]